MSFSDSITNTAKRIFDEGLDEVLIFTFIFIFILFTSRDNGGTDLDTTFGGLLPIIVIGAFILLYFGLGRTDNNPN